jgi:hypothetical protein
VSALRTMQIATRRPPLASVPISKGYGHGTHWSSTLQVEADRVGIRWAGHGFLLMGTPDIYIC